MRLEIRIDDMSHEIDSTDPELLGRWIAEILARIGPWYPSTQIQVRAQPSWLPTPDGRGRSDWITDSRVIGNIYTVRTPQDIVDALQQQITEAETLSRS